MLHFEVIFISMTGPDDTCEVDLKAYMDLWLIFVISGIIVSLVYSHEYDFISQAVRLINYLLIGRFLR